MTYGGLFAKRHTDWKVESGRAHCPCCGVIMTRGRGQPAKDTDNTEGHVAGRQRSPLWIPQCHKCNQDQGAKSLSVWHQSLTDRGDPRAARVGAIVHLLQLGWDLV